MANRFQETDLSPPMTKAAMRRLFGAVCVDEALFRRAKEAIGDKTVAEEDRMYKFVLDEVAEHWEQYNTMPDLGTLRSSIQADLSDDFTASQEDIDECAEILAAAKAVQGLSDKARAKYVAASHRDLDVVIQEVYRLEILIRIGRGDLSISLHESQQQLREALATQSDRFDSPFLGELDERPPGRFTLTGNRLIDMYTNNTGPATGDILGHAAARGAGKSTCVGMVACDVAGNERAAAKRENREPRFVYIFNYEKIEDPMTHALSYAGKIPRDTIEEFIYTKDLSNFSTGRNYKPYERELFARMIRRAERDEGPYPLTEIGRLAATRKKLSKNLMLANFTGAKPEFKKMSEGFVKGILEFIESHQLACGSPGVEAVFLDYAGTCARAHLRSPKPERMGESAERKLIEDLPFQLKNLIANPLQCFGWISHQLAAVEADKAAGTRPNPNAFKDCKSFAENCDYAFVNGKPTPDEGIAIFVHSKSRRGQERPDQIAKLVGDFCHWIPVESGYSIVNGRVMDAEAANFVGGGDSFIAPDE